MDELDILWGLRAPNGSAEKRQAANALLQSTSGRVLRLAYRHGVCHDEYEDVLQSVAEAIVTKASGFRGATVLAARAWISKVIRRRIVDALRRQIYRENHCVPLENDAEFDDFENEPVRLPKALIHVDFALATELAVEDFAEDNPAAAYALQLQAEGYSIREIAEKIGRAEPATTTYLHMCRKKLRHYLDK